MPTRGKSLQTPENMNRSHEEFDNKSSNTIMEWNAGFKYGIIFKQIRYYFLYFTLLPRKLVRIQVFDSIDVKTPFLRNQIAYFNQSWGKEDLSVCDISLRLTVSQSVQAVNINVAQKWHFRFGFIWDKALKSSRFSVGAFFFSPFPRVFKTANTIKIIARHWLSMKYADIKKYSLTFVQ